MPLPIDRIYEVLAEILSDRSKNDHLCAILPDSQPCETVEISNIADNILNEIIHDKGIGDHMAMLAEEMVHELETQKKYRKNLNRIVKENEDILSAKLDSLESLEVEDRISDSNTLMAR